MAPADSTLAYIDQISFLGLRALGRGPLPQMTWVYEHRVDLDALRRFHRNLGRGLLGRRIERSVLPFGRHHWVAYADPADLDVAARELPRRDVPAWTDQQLRRPLDPECGPPWRLAVQPLAGGGAAVTLIASHTVCDGLAMCTAVAEAVRGLDRELGYPPPNARSRGQALRTDIGVTARTLPEVARSLAAAVRLARGNRRDLSASISRSAHSDTLTESTLVTVPTVTACLPIRQWDERAESLGGTSNSLFAGIAAGFGRLIGRVNAAGSVELSFPVSERTEGDTRGNALSAMFLAVDPDDVTTSLAGVRAEISRGLAALNQTRDDLPAVLALAPLIPRRVARRLEGLTQGSGVTIGCSNLGELDPAVNRPDGTDAEFLSLRMVESRITAGILDRLGGTVFMVSARVNDRVLLTVSAWQAGAPNSRDRLAGLIRQVLAEYGLTAVIE